MKSIIVATIVFVLTVFVSVADTTDEKSFGGIFLEYGMLTGLGHSYAHNTHSADYFLPNSDKSGSAGKTELDDVNFLSIGFRSHWEFLPSAYFGAEIGILYNFREGARHKNDNDPRPDSNAAFVFSDDHWGTFIGGELIYEIPGTKFFVGGDIRANFLLARHGWERYGKEEVNDSEIILFPTYGPKIGYRIDEFARIEFSLAVGEQQGGILSLVIGF